MNIYNDDIYGKKHFSRNNLNAEKVTLAWTMVFTIGEKIQFLESVFGKGTVDRNKKNIALSCPVCKEKGKDVSIKKKLIVRLDIDICHCWVCGWSSKTVLPLLKRFGTYSQFEQYKNYVLSTVLTVDDDEPK